MAENKLERRALTGLHLEERDADGKKSPVLRGYAAVFNADSEMLGWFIERIAPGAFDKTLAEGADVRALVDHDSGKILGRSKSGTLRMEVDDHGLAVEIDPPDTSAGRDVVESVRRGDLDGMSFAFTTVSDSWETKDKAQVRTLKEVELHDVSVVAYPAYPDTNVALRSMEAAQKAAESDKKPSAIGVAMRQRVAVARAKVSPPEAGTAAPSRSGAAEGLAADAQPSAGARDEAANTDRRS